MGNDIIIILFGLFLPCCLSLRYFYQPQYLTWDDAQKNCREHYTDLATFESQEDIKSLRRPAGVAGLVWIGLREDPSTWKQMSNASTSWRWSSTGETSQTGFSNWAPYEPNNYLGESCVRLDGLRFWLDIGCETLLQSVCFTGPSENKTYVFNPSWLSWSEAQQYCRQKHTDLATIEDEKDKAALNTAVPIGAWAWIGLYRIPFAWSDNNPSTFRNWAGPFPDNWGGIQFCGAELDSHLWDDIDCTWKLASICYKPDWKTRKTTVRQTLSAAYDLSKPEILQQIQQQLTELMAQNQTAVQIQLKIVPVESET